MNGLISSHLSFHLKFIPTYFQTNDSDWNENTRCDEEPSERGQRNGIMEKVLHNAFRFRKNRNHGWRWNEPWIEGPGSEIRLTITRAQA